MQQPRFKIVFSGQLMPGAAMDETREKLANLFKSSTEQIDALFKGDKVILKRNLEEAEADKYLAVLTRAGAQASKESDAAPEFSLVKIDEEEPVDSAQMRCPKCGHDQNKAPVCAACGIVVEKFLARQVNQPEATPAPSPSATVEVSPYAPPKAQSVSPATEFAELKLFGITGRLGRVRYLGWNAALNGIFLGLYLLIMLLGVLTSPLVMVLLIPVYVALLVFSVQISVRRLNDMGMSGWFCLLVLVTGGLFGIVMMVVPGNEGANRYGPPPPPNSGGVTVLAFSWLLIPVIGILAAIAIPAYHDYVERAQQHQQQDQ